MRLKSNESTSLSNEEKKGNRALSIVSTVFFVGLMAFFPLYISNTSYAIITYEKATFFTMFTIISVIMVIAVILVSMKSLQVKNYFIDNEPKRKLSIYEYALIAFLMLTFLSAIFSPWKDIVWRGYTQGDFKGRWEGFWVFLCYGLTFFVIARFYKPKRYHFLIFAGSAILLSLYGVLQVLGFDILVKIGFYTKEITDHFKSINDRLSLTFLTTLGNINVVSAYCSLVILFLTVLFAGEWSKWGLLYLAASIMTFALLLIANSDAGKVGVLGAMVLLIPYWLSNRERLGKIFIALSGWSAVYACYHSYLSALKSSSGFDSLSASDQSFLLWFTPRNPMIFIILAIVLLAIGLCLLLLVKKWAERPLMIAGCMFIAISIISGILFIEVAGSRLSDQPNNIVWQAREILHGRMEDDFGSARGWVWKRGLSVIPDNPILGTGPDTFLYALSEEMRQESLELYKVVFDKAHNTYLQIAVCMGLPALFAYLVFLGGLFLSAIKKAFSRPLLLAVSAAAISYLINCFFQVDTPIDRPLLWVALGVMAGEIWRDKIENIE